MKHRGTSARGRRDSAFRILQSALESFLPLASVDSQEEGHCLRRRIVLVTFVRSQTLANESTDERTSVHGHRRAEQGRHDA